MKKLFAFISVLAACTAFMFADVSAQKNADGSVAVTFFYGNPRATEVLLAGDFTNWQNGALPMEKGEKGFSLTVNFKAGDEARYKFISDGNWTTDLRAPDFVDDGFGGKNSHIVVADLLGGDEDAQAARAKINFVSWSMIGVQGKFKTQAVSDPSKKGFDTDQVTLGFKSYDKFVGNFIPNAPVYIEIALAESDLEDYSGEDKIKYLYRKNDFDVEQISAEDGLKGLINGIAAHPVSYFARTTNNSEKDKGPGTNPFLGHLKFGWNTPYLNYVTGFNYAKPDVRDAITWTTVCSSWDAGYEHVGGFNQFSLGSKLANAIDGVTLDIGFAPNKTADRRGTKYGYWGWAGAKIGDLAIDFQSNGMYDGDYLFYDPVEHDFILGAKDELEVGDGKLSFAVQGLLATHQKKTEDLVASNLASSIASGAESPSGSAIDYFGYSTDVWYRDSEFNGLQNMAANAKVGYKTDLFNVGLSYQLRGMQASMLYVRENHDDGTFDLSSQLGVLNSQVVKFNGGLNLLDGALNVNLGVSAKMALSELKPTVVADDEAKTVLQKGDEACDIWTAQCPGWWVSRSFIDEDQPLFSITGGAEFKFAPDVTYTFEDLGITVGGYADMKLKAYQYSGYNPTTKAEYDADESNKYGSSDSAFKLNVAGLKFNMKPEDNDLLKNIDVFYGFDLSNSNRWFNTLVGQVEFPEELKATLAVGIKTENALSKSSKDKTDIMDANNPFAFALGVSKKFQNFKKPTVYAQFVYNMDPFKHFGDGQDSLNLDRSNVNGSWEKEGKGSIDAVDWYDGSAAVRCGIRWDI